jgi:hypothetical protein
LIIFDRLVLNLHSERWVLHSTTEYANSIIAQTGLLKPSEATLTRVAEELFYELQRTGLNIPQPIFKKAHRWSVHRLKVLRFTANYQITNTSININHRTENVSTFTLISYKKKKRRRRRRRRRRRSRRSLTTPGLA